MASRRKELETLIDDFGRTADAEFDFATLLDFLDERLELEDEAEAFDLVSSSSYLFEMWKNTDKAVFVPRRRFFQGAEFQIVPTRQEVQGGFLFPGHRFMPFVSREVFPGDLWLVLPDGSAPHLKRISLPIRLAADLLALFGEEQSAEYLVSEDLANAAVPDLVSVSAYDLREFYAETGFRQGDALMLRVVDWLQGVYSVSHLPADPHEFPDAHDWTQAMRKAYDRMQYELGSNGDCYEQLAIMLLMAQEDGTFPVMKNPPQSLAGFLERERDIVINPHVAGGLLCAPDAEREGEPEASSGTFDDDLADLMTPLDLAFKELGFACSETETEAYMRDALFQGLEDSDAVLGRIVAGRPLVFRSVDDQEEFHQLWNDLWLDVNDIYVRDADSFGELRSDLLLLNDQRLALLRGLDAHAAPQALATNPTFHEFGLLSASLTSLLGILNLEKEIRSMSTEGLNEIASMLLEQLPEVLDELKKELEIE